MNPKKTSSGPRAWVFDVQRFSVHDGPGIRTTIFFKGCPLRCAWCQNPESFFPVRELLLYPDLCIHCGACAAVCPEIRKQPAQDASGSSPEREARMSRSLTSGEGTQLETRNPKPETRNPKPEPDMLARPENCAVCGGCVEVCVAAARRIAGWEAGLDELVESSLRDKPFYGDKGGVTFGGGEPLAQWDFVRELAVRLRAEGAHLALDTACIAPRDVLEAVPDYFDLVLADLKIVSPDKHLRWTGAANKGILEAIRLWSRTMEGRLWISVPLIPGVQDEKELRRMAEFVSSLDPAPPVRFLPYHRLGDSKHTALGKPAPAFPGSTETLAARARAIFAERGLRLLEQ